MHSNAQFGYETRDLPSHFYWGNKSQKPRSWDFLRVDHHPSKKASNTRLLRRSIPAIRPTACHPSNAPLYRENCKYPDNPCLTLLLLAVLRLVASFLPQRLPATHPTNIGAGKCTSLRLRYAHH